MPSFIACRPSMIDATFSPSLLLDISSSRRLITQGMRNINRSRPGKGCNWGQVFALERAQRRVAPTNGCESRHGKSRKPCSLDGRRGWKRYLLKPIDKVPQGGMSNYPGRNERERRSSLVKVYVHWSSLSIVGEDKIL